MTGPSFVGRALLAATLTAVFYAFALIVGIGQALGGQLSPADWRATCEAVGVADLPLAPGQAPSASRASWTENRRS